MRRAILAAIALTLMPAVPVAAQHTVEKGIEFLDTTELKRIYGKGKFVLVNTLSPLEFQEKRIAGSINVPLSHYAQGRVSLPEDRGTRIVFYCMGEG